MDMKNVKLDWYGFRLSHVAGCRDSYKERLSPIKCRGTYLLKKDSAPWSYLVGCLVNSPVFPDSLNSLVIPSSRCSLLPYILESNPAPFLQFQRVKKSDADLNRSRIRFAVDSWILEN